MTRTERLPVPSGLTVQRQLLVAVKALCVLEAPVFPNPELQTIDAWRSHNGKVGLDGVALTAPLANRNYRVVRATLEFGDIASTYSVFVGNPRHQAPEDETFDYNADPISSAVLQGFRDYLTSHDHIACLRARREAVQASQLVA